MDIRVTKEEVLAWMAADPDNRSSIVASKHFGIKRSTIRAWASMARTGARPSKPNTEPVAPVAGTVHVLPMRVSSTPAIAPPVPKPPLPASMQAVARRATRALIERFEFLAPTADPKEAAAMFAALTDRFDILGTIKPATRRPVADPATTEGRAALVDEVAALPPDLLADAVRKQQAG